MTAVSSFASAAEGAGASETGAFEAALTSVVDVVKVKAENLTDATATAAEKVIDFTDAADLNLIKAKVADEAEKVVTAEGTSGFNRAALDSLVDDTATSIKNVNDQIEAVADLTSDATKNVFSTLQVLNEQVKTAVQTGGAIAFTDPNTVQTAANNFAPQDVTISANSILEGTKDLVIGSLATVDKDQGSGVAFTYKIAEAVGTDYASFEINSNNELVLKASPDYSAKSSYEVFVVTTDEGGKTFSKKIEVSVTPDPHENFLVKFTVNYVEAGDVGAEYNTLLTSSETNYEAFMTKLFNTMDAVDDAYTSTFPLASEMPEDGDFYQNVMVPLIGAGGSVPTVQIDESNGKFTVPFTNSSNSEVWTMEVKMAGYTNASSNFGGTDSNGDEFFYYEPVGWKVAGGFTGFDIYETTASGSNLALSVSVDATSMQITAKTQGIKGGLSNGDVASVKLEGDFSGIDAEHLFDIVDQLSLDPSSSSSGGEGSHGSSGGNEGAGGEGSSGSIGGSEGTGGEGSHGSSSGSLSASAPYTISKVYIYGQDSSTESDLTALPVATANIGDGSLSLVLGDFTMSIVSDDLPDYITAGDIFDFADVDLLDVEDVIQEGNDGLFTLSHATHGELVIIESDMSNAPAGGTVTIGDGDTFGTYEGNRFVSDSNDIVAAYFDFGDLVVSDAQFQTYWESIDGITDMFAEIA